VATKAMAGLSLQEYPPVTMPPEFVAVKVPQFSFSRLSGADPVLGVEMASTGEVACFGRTKYEAYIKGLIATGFRLPNKNILLSIGSFKDKLEMLPSIERLHKMGYNLFATAGTADYITEHNIPVKFLEALPSGDHDKQKAEYSLTQHLSNNLIDLYINLPSSNRFRRPANYMSRGYRTRRMAVDYQTPLVTNVKNAKLLIEALARHYDLEVTKLDCQEFFPPSGTHEESNMELARLNGSLSLTQLLAKSPFRRKHITSVKQFSRADLHLLFTIAQEMRLGAQRQGCLDVLKGRVLCTMFFEPSTRTSGSFDAAMKRLGGEVVVVNESVSSTQKGESIADTVRTLGCYTDAIVLRHPNEESIDIAAKFSGVPVINAGNGSREHPTQAILDIFTIREELGTVNGLTITFVGDLKYGRTVHSLCELLSHYDVTINLVSPKSLKIPDNVRDSLKSRGQLNKVSNELSPELVASADVIYCTRVQKERFPDVASYEQVKDAFVIDNKLLKGAKANMIVMHPLPRNNEIHEEVDFDPRAAYFRQVSRVRCSIGIKLICDR
jgi:carbamoyl-phosphate synthase/aspartate carbamoyltransferase